MTAPTPPSRSAADLIAQVKAVAADDPEHRNTTNPPRYFTYDNQPGCLVGHALARMGLTAEQVAAGEGHSIRASLPVLGFTEVSYQQRRWLTLAQDAQDDGMSWGDAVHHADTVVTL